MRSVSDNGLDGEWDEGEGRAQALLRFLGFLILGLLAILLLEASPAQALAESGQAPPEPEAPTLRLHSGDSGQDTAVELAVMLESHLDLDISGLLAKGVLTQRFRNDSERWVEAEYLLPLPHDAAVTRLDIGVGERRIVGVIRERAEARKVYDAARKAGKRSALLEQQRPHLFTSRVANIPPGEEISIEVELIIPVSYHSGEFSLRFPTTLTPAYIPGVRAAPGDSGAEAAGEFLPLTGAGWVLPTDEVPDAPLVVGPQHRERGSDTHPLNPLNLTVQLAPGIPLASVGALYHELRIERRGGDYQLSLRDGVAEMDRDLVLRWVGQASALPQAAMFREQVAADGQTEDYALLMMLPPLAPRSDAPLPRELVLVIDVSGSMQGESLRQARSAALHALSTLAPTDFVNVIAFNDRVQTLFTQARIATPVTLASAERFVNALQADRGTEMLPALKTSLRMPAPQPDSPKERPLRQVIFITDGAVANEEALFDLLAAERGASRLFTVGIGSAPNSHFMQRAADLGRGEAIFIAQPQEVAPRLNALFDRIQRPLVRDLRVSWPVGVEAFPADLPDLYAGQPLMQVVRLKNRSHTAGDQIDDAPGVVRVTGRLVGRAWERQIRMPAQAGDVGVAVHWARRKLAYLMQGRQRGVSREAIRDEALPLALRFSIASPFTSFVAVEERVARPTDATVGTKSIANAQPKGSRRFAFAQGATTGLAKLYLGLLLLFIALFVYAMTRAEPE